MNCFNNLHHNLKQFMKSTHLLLLLAITFSFNACQSDDDNNEAQTTAKGTWRMQSLELGSEYDFNGDGTASNDIISETNCLQNETYSFGIDGNGVFNSTESLDIELTVDSNTNGVTYSIDCIAEDPFSEAFTWQQQGNSMTLMMFGEELTGTIDQDTMTLVFDEAYIVEVYDGSTVTEVSEPITLVLSRE